MVNGGNVEEGGNRGAAVAARMLFADDNSSGRLAITIPRSLGQLPVYYHHKPSKAYWLSGGWTHVPGYADMSAGRCVLSAMG